MADYKTKGTCSVNIHYDVVDGKVTDVSFLGGCNGNLKAISRLVDGLPVDEVISKLGGIRCGFRDTSCGDQLAKALTAWKQENPDMNLRGSV
ncbi:MAG: TIGR03905 family TSCPD domain-containing protein [Lachnospiraceae bacterium]|nr:TIGR03905 family TSCPD domain-containing protein [Lachnospiraceae bacterium]